MPSSNLAYANERREDRVEVHHRAPAELANGRMLSILIVNISPNGLMARCENPPATGERLTIRLPNMTPVTATIRWALGGRIGCEFDAAIPAAPYFALLPRLHA